MAEMPSDAQQRDIYGSNAYKSLMTLRSVSEASSIMGLIELTADSSQHKTQLDEVKRLAKQMELRDSITIVFGS